MKREVAEARHVAREDQLAVDAKAAADAGEEESGRPADGPVDGAEGKEEVKRRPVDHALAVAAVDGKAVDGEAAQQHADVLAALSPEPQLAQSAGERHAGQVGD